MNLIPEVLYITLALDVKFQVTPINICAFAALGLFVAIVWRWYKKRTDR